MKKFRLTNRVKSYLERAEVKYPLDKISYWSIEDRVNGEPHPLREVHGRFIDVVAYATRLNNFNVGEVRAVNVRSLKERVWLVDHIQPK